jgi:hypothetical protein
MVDIFQIKKSFHFTYPPLESVPCRILRSPSRKFKLPTSQCDNIDFMERAIEKLAELYLTTRVWRALLNTAVLSHAFYEKNDVEQSI